MEAGSASAMSKSAVHAILVLAALQCVRISEDSEKAFNLKVNEPSIISAQRTNAIHLRLLHEACNQAQVPQLVGSLQI
jgi:hypothetical protein